MKMKNLLLAAALLMGSWTANAFEDGQWNVHVGTGFNSTRGIAGLSVERFFGLNHALTLAMGADFVGATSTIGYKYFGEKTTSSESAWTKCFFVFQCDSYLHAGIAGQYAGATRLEISQNGQLLRTYEIDPKYLGLISIGDRRVFTSNITMDFELTYKKILSGGKSVQTLGAAADDTDAREMGQNGFGLGIAVGYLF